MLKASRFVVTEAQCGDSERQPSPRAENIRVLVVDDDSDARELTTIMLESNGMLVRTAANAAEALELLTDYTPDVIVSDIGMPEEDGYSLIRRVRKLAAIEKCNVPAIALTAFARADDEARSLAAGFNRHLSKPAEVDHLIRAINTLAKSI